MSQRSAYPGDIEAGYYKVLPRRRGVRLALAFFFVLFILHVPFLLKHSNLAFNAPMFAFADSPRPSWIDNPVERPLILRIAIICRPDEYEQRQVLRDIVLAGIRKTDVQFEYKFFVGRAVGWLKGGVTRRRIAQENEKYGDITVLDEIDDIPQRLSEKRFSALKWGGAAPNDTYDYFMTMDSDTICRFNTMARWMSILLKDQRVNPRKDPVMIGRMASHLTYFQTRIPDGNKNPALEDEYVKGPWFSYPMGVGYMLSSSLVDTMLSAEPPLPHHIHYPSDDVMIGAWVAGLRNFHDESILWESTAEHSPLPIHRVYPRPYIPYIVDTKIIDDKVGWHDPPGRSGNDGPISWNSVCIHHVSATEMKAIRVLKEFRGEWNGDI